MPIAEGFTRQRLVVVPRPVVEVALDRDITRRITVTDVGHFPDAADHGVVRRRGADETILVVCGAGSGWLHLGDRRFDVAAGSAFVVPRGAPHAYGASERDPWTVWWCHLRGADVDELVRGMSASAEEPVLPLHRPERPIALLDEMITTLTEDQSWPRLVLAAGSAFTLATVITGDRRLPADGDPVQRAMDHLAQTADRPIRVADVAALVGLSPSHLTALFRRATGGGVLAHHAALRMAKARQLLDGTRAPVADVAQELGYDDPFVFSRAFRRHHAMSPRAYRNRDA